MANQHFFDSPSGLVQKAQRSFVTRNPHIGLDDAHRVVYSRTHVRSKVSIISGGGSGHEPGWMGYVGDGMLSAAVAGDIFASPSTKQVLAAARAVPSDEGTILCITNYTGDRLHFGLAREKIHASGRKIAQIPLSDDVSLPRSKVENLGRRGIAGHVFVLKLLGAAAAAGWGFEDCVRLGSEANANIASIGVSLGLCHVMGRVVQPESIIDSCVLGMGVHNEPGLRRISPKPTPEDLIKEMLVYVLDPNDLERSYVKFDDGDEIWLLVNNLGGIPALEIEGLTQVILEQLSQDYGIMPSRIYVGPFETSLNAPGFSLSLCNLSAIANATSRPVASLRDLLDAPTTASAWPRSSYQVSLPVSSDTPVSHSGNSLPDGNKHNTVSDTPAPYALLPALKTACLAAIEAEPDITRFDMIMGDGDCGEAVRAACEALLARFSEAPFAESHFSLFSALEAINETLEDVGGSLFAILSILTTAFVGHLQGNSDITRSTVGNAAGSAVRALHAYTGARVGDRTCMDVLIPFCEVLESTGGDLVAAVEAAEEAAKATAIMAPRFGRAAYVGDDAPAAGDMSPDPGAYAVARWLHGFARKWDEMAV